MHRFRRTACVAAFVAVFSAPLLAQQGPSAEDVKAAGEEFDAGRKAFKSNEYAEAAEHFEAADRRVPSDKALELAIRGRQKAGQLDRAATLATLGLERHPSSKALKKIADPILRAAGLDLHKLSVHCDVGCELIVDTKLVHGAAATERTVWLNPGDYTVYAGWTLGRTEQKPVTATKGGSGEVSFKQPPEPVEAAPAAPVPVATVAATSAPPPAAADQGPAAEHGGWSPVVFWIGAGLTAALGGVTVWSGIDTQNNPGQEAVREGCVGQGEACPLYQDGRDRQNRTNILLGATAGVGIATIVIGAVATDWSGKKGSAQRSIQPWVGLGQGPSIGATGRF